MEPFFLAGELKKADPDRYLLSFFVPRPVRPALQALFLLNHEISRTRSVVSDTRLGHIRLQWWRDEISKIYGGGPCGQIPVLSTLAPYIRSLALPQELFEAMVYAREFDLEDVAPSSLEGLRNYAEFVNAPLNRLALKIAGEDAEDFEIRLISTDYELLQILRSVPYMLGQRRCYLPSDLLVQRKLTPQKIIDFNHQKEIVEIVKDAASSVGVYPKPKSALLSKMQGMTRIYLKYYKKNDFDVFGVKMQSPPPFLALRMVLPFRI